MRAARPTSTAERLHDSVALAAHVGRVDAPQRGCRLRQGDELSCLRIGSRRVLERRRHADGAVAHGRAHQLLHPSQLGGIGLHVVEAQHGCAHLGRAHEGREVDPDALLLEALEVVAQAAPVGIDLERRVDRGERLPGGVGLRCDRRALAGDLRRDALMDLRRQARVDQDRQLGLAEHVDEARGDDPTRGVDGALARSRAQGTDGGDAAVADADVAGNPRRAGAVDDAPVRDDEVEAGRRRSECAPRDEQRGRADEERDCASHRRCAGRDRA